MTIRILRNFLRGYQLIFNPGAALPPLRLPEIKADTTPPPTPPRRGPEHDILAARKDREAFMRDFNKAFARAYREMSPDEREKIRTEFPDYVRSAAGNDHNHT